MQAENGVSLENYSLKLDQELGKLTNLTNYFALTLNRLGAKLHVPDALTINLFDRSPIFDRYIALLEFLTLLEGAGESISATSHNSVVRLSAAVGDTALNNILLVKDPASVNLSLQSRSQIHDLLDKYTEGNYLDSADLAKKLLLQNASNFILYDIYVKSCYYSGQRIEDIFEKDSTASQILSCIGTIYESPSNWIQAATKLQKFALMFYYFQISSGISYFLEKEYRMQLPVSHKFRHICHSDFTSPSLLNLSHSRTFPQLVGKLREAIGSSIALDFTIATQEAKLSKSIPLFSSQIPEQRSSFYRAAAALEIGQYNQSKKWSKELLELLMDEDTNGAHLILDEVIVNLCTSLLKSGKIDDCIETAAKWGNRSTSLAKKIPFRLICDETKKKATKASIYTAVVYHLAREPNGSIYTQYANYLDSADCRRPTELIAKGIETDEEITIPFLRDVCTMQTMASSYFFSGTDDLEKERIEICRHLISRDGENQEKGCVP